MDSYKYKGRQWVACHECELSGGSVAIGLVCKIGERITDKNSNRLNHGCWIGVLKERFKNEEKENTGEIHD